MHKLHPLLIASGLLFASNSFASTYSAEARGAAMGGVGVVSASYLTAPFYNPALVAIYRRNDDAGMILPSVSLSINDKDDVINRIEDIGNIKDDNELEEALKSIDGDSVKFDLGAAFALGIPNRYIAANLFGQIYTESFITPRVHAGNEYSDSFVEAVTLGVAEVGITLAKYQTFMYQHISWGITPKMQRINTYGYSVDFDGFDSGKIRDNENSETAINFDVGALWFHGPFRVGFAGKNMIPRDIETKSYSFNGSTIQHTYRMRPALTVGAGIVADYFTISADFDLNEQKRFAGFNDNIQMLSVGFEVDLLRQIQARGGYKVNLAQDNETTLTAGIGLSPLNLIEMDIAASYTDESAFGITLNFLATY
ncbi:conjugal transfer protein TraF [Vibrio sp. 10N.286.49.B3]|uniref:conjugal transfer protein TraF n=1 Tax=Vibrio sp. 10N.286.49.B3 TaxID=1880855 RepID=UPI000CAED22F|nr:conjugal transfer protein TraF [Vibrio sp. 10N.286.49.B3]PMH43813.1 conjugal transfer protein TraF [Vibrio sp. 10N.286.49.B3]